MRKVRGDVSRRTGKNQIPSIEGLAEEEVFLAGNKVPVQATLQAEPLPVGIAEPEPEPEPVVSVGRLKIKTMPNNARVRIMDIGPKYQAGMEVALNENYDVLVDKAGYVSWRQTIRLDQANQNLNVSLKKAKPKKQWFEPEMVVIPAGSFRMGDLSGKGDPDEKPVHRVNIKSFLMGKYEITFNEYDAYVKASGAKSPDDEGWGRSNRPVINVSWDDTKSYIYWLNSQTGSRYRLPTEAEWEYGARGRSTTLYSWGSRAVVNRANCRSCGRIWHGKKTASIGSFKANAFGLYDVHGNVWEWVEDRFHESYRGATIDGSAWVEGDSKRRVLRGGAWGSIPTEVRAASRNWARKDTRNFVTGFRLAQDR